MYLIMSGVGWQGTGNKQTNYLDGRIREHEMGLEMV
jgi:hypothetical protein